MPSANTFTIAPIADFVRRYLDASTTSIDPFARNCPWATHRNDLNPDTAAQFHLDAEDFCLQMQREGVTADVGIFDPPYSPRQISEIYQGIGREVGQDDTQSGALYRRVRDALDALIKPGAVVLSFGWNSGGMGLNRGYVVEEVLIVAHGGGRHDTICIAERKQGGPEKKRRLPLDIAFWSYNGVECLTPRFIFDALDTRFDLDPASPGADVAPGIPCDRHLTRADDGLVCSWGKLFVWLNPPFGRGVIDQWTRKFAEHGNGIILVPDRTSTVWYQTLARKADLILELNVKFPFIRPDEEEETGKAFPIGIHLIAIGERGVIGLENAYRAGLGLLVKPYFPGAAVA